MGGFYSTPTFSLFQRGLEPRIVKRFRGINVYKSRTALTPEWAQDCLNVLVPGSGGLSKFRLPVALSPAIAGVGGPSQFFDFQQGNGTRQVVASFPNNSLYYFTWNAAGTLLNAGVLVEAAGNDAPPWSFVESNNILFGANGQRMMKWTGAAWQPWGFSGPVNAPTTTAVALPGGLNLTQINGAIGQNIINCFTATPFNIAVGQNAVIAGTVHYNGTYPVNAVYTSPPFATDLTQLTSTPPPSTVIELNAGTITPSFPVPLIGWSWGYSYKNSITGHVGNISPATAQIIPAAGNGTQLLAVAPADNQIDTIVWFRTLDGGGDYFRLCEININTGAITTPNTGTQVVAVSSGGKFIAVNDNNTPDSALDKTTRGPLVNNPPPVGKYLAVGQSRVAIFNLVGAPNQIAYTGFEQILVGRPEESCPPNNRLLLSIGAEAINGGGIIDAGIVAFSATKRMYMLRGNLEDITLAAPIQFSAFLKELPWNMGTLCHDSIQSTPYGLLFWATDKTVNIFDGYNQPQDLSEPVYPILRRATPGQESNAKSCYFNWLERDWYGLTFAIDGSLINNFTIFWALHKDTNEVDIFPCAIPMSSMMVLSTPLLQRVLAIGNGGIISNLPVSQDTVGGIADLSIIPATGGNLQAYWRNGYFGSDTPQRSEMWRWLRLVTDQPPQSFQVTIRLVDDDMYPVTAPYIIGPVKLTTSRQAINRRAKRCSVEINFPQQDVSSNVLELQVMSVPSSDR